MQVVFRTSFRQEEIKIGSRPAFGCDNGLSPGTLIETVMCGLYEPPTPSVVMCSVLIFAFNAAFPAYSNPNGGNRLALGD